MTVGLVDLDGFIYRAGFASQKTIRVVTADFLEGAEEFRSASELNEWLEDNNLTKEEVDIQVHVEAEPAAHAIYVLKSLVKEALNVSGSHDSILYLTGKGNFRDEIYDQYKANRRNSDKPANYEALREYAIERLDAILVNGMEADDALGIKATELAEAGEDFVIITQDKDLLTVPGEHYDPVKQTFEYTDELLSAFYFYCQLLTGDSTDNIPGLYRVGKKKAAEMLEDCREVRELYETCCAIYEERGVSHDDLVRNAQLLHMLRKEGEMWTPPEAV